MGFKVSHIVWNQKLRFSSSFWSFFLFQAIILDKVCLMFVLYMRVFKNVNFSQEIIFKICIGSIHLFAPSLNKISPTADEISQ